MDKIGCFHVYNLHKIARSHLDETFRKCLPDILSGIAITIQNIISGILVASLHVYVNIARPTKFSNAWGYFQSKNYNRKARFHCNAPRYVFLSLRYQPFKEIIKKQDTSDDLITLTLIRSCLASLTSQMTEILGKKHMIMTWDQAISPFHWITPHAFNAMGTSLSIWIKYLIATSRNMNNPISCVDEIRETLLITPVLIGRFTRFFEHILYFRL